MARGWESKSVEDQMVEAEERKGKRLKPAMTFSERDVASRKTGLHLSRAKVLSDLHSARDDRHRAVLQKALEHIDRELAGL
jgi:hypothetical protein